MHHLRTNWRFPYEAHCVLSMAMFDSTNVNHRSRSIDNLKVGRHRVYFGQVFPDHAYDAADRDEVNLFAIKTKLLKIYSLETNKK